MTGVVGLLAHLKKDWQNNNKIKLLKTAITIIIIITAIIVNTNFLIIYMAIALAGAQVIMSSSHRCSRLTP